MAIVVYRPHAETPKNKGSRSFNLIELKPGQNQVTLSELELLKSHPSIPKYLSCGAIEFLEEEIEVIKNPEYPLAALSIADAIKVVKEESKLATLEAWKNAEANSSKSRKGIITEINHQIKMIKEGIN